MIIFCTFLWVVGYMYTCGALIGGVARCPEWERNWGRFYLLIFLCLVCWPIILGTKYGVS